MPRDFKMFSSRDLIDDLDNDKPTTDLRQRICKYTDPMRYRYQFPQFTAHTKGINLEMQRAARFSVMGMVSVYISHLTPPTNLVNQYPRPPLLNIAFGIGDLNAEEDQPDPVSVPTGYYQFGFSSWQDVGKLFTVSGQAFTQIGFWTSTSPVIDPAVPEMDLRFSLALDILPFPGSSVLTVDFGRFFIPPVGP